MAFPHPPPKNDHPSPRSHQVPITPQLEMWSEELLPPCCFKLAWHCANDLLVTSALLCLCFQQPYSIQRKEFHSIPSHPTSFSFLLSFSPPCGVWVCVWEHWHTGPGTHGCFFSALWTVMHLCLKHYPHSFLTLPFIFWLKIFSSTSLRPTFCVFILCLSHQD